VGVVDDELRHNTMLAGLPGDELALLRPRLQVRDMQVRDPVYQPREVISDVYFPLTAVFSMVALAEEQITVEVGTVGFEGMVGLPLFLGSPTSPNAVFCQISGRAARLSAADLHEFLHQDGALHRRLHRFVQTTMVQLAQNVVCMSTHPAAQRAARWLLVTGDRVRSPSFELTQDFLGQMLGVRRTTVSEVAGQLQADGLIRYVRGRVTLTDRRGLERVACACYWTLREEFDRLHSEL